VIQIHDFKPPSLNRGGGLYLHIPFCGSICSYCHFNRGTDHSLTTRKQFAETVKQELKLRANDLPLNTIYFGGGTPSQLEPDLLAEIIGEIRTQFLVCNDAEITCEANPESFTRDLAKIWKQAGVNRVSLGVQSLDSNVLKTLGRKCNPETAREALELATSEFDNVSADWILAHGCTIDQLKSAFSEAAQLGVKHISFYILELHRNTKMYDLVSSKKLKMIDDSETAELYKAGVQLLEQLGYMQYEISNFAVEGYESKHNSAYWKRVPYLGVGPGASGFDGKKRYQNYSQTSSWSEKIEKGVLPEELTEFPDSESKNLEKLFLGLRTKDGVSLELFKTQKTLNNGIDDGLWEINGTNLVLTLDGMLQIDAIEEHLAGQLG
jgi:oxygen-independent coproporphyrinogen III oxidase